MSSASKSPARSRFFGVWRLDKWELWRDGEFYAFPHGESGTGQIIYSSQGLMSAFLQSAAWPQTGDGGAPLSESFVSYSGRWRLEGDMVGHDVEFASVSGWVGRTLERRASFSRNTLLLETPPVVNRRGHELVNRLYWRKAR